jgi:hypothetical protein
MLKSLMMSSHAGNEPNLSLDERNAALQYKEQDRNNQPHPDFCSAMPTQMAN